MAMGKTYNCGKKQNPEVMKSFVKAFEKEIMPKEMMLTKTIANNGKSK